MKNSDNNCIVVGIDNGDGNRDNELTPNIGEIREDQKSLGDFENGIDGIKKFQKEYMEVPQDLIINEVMNSNYEYLPQNGGEYYDWIELYNNSKDTIKLSDYCIGSNFWNTSCKLC